MSNKIEIRVPDIGDFSDVEVIEVHVGAGDTVALEDPLITLETDKASMDVPSSAAGRVLEVAVSAGDKVSEGSLVLTVEAAGSAAGDAVEATADNAAAPAPPQATAASPDVAQSAGAELAVQVPDIGDFTDVDVIEVHVAPGDRISAEDPLITLETDKASMDVPAPAAGVVQSLAVKAGDKVSEGSTVLVMLTEAAAQTADVGTSAAVSDKPAAAPSASPAPAAAATPARRGELPPIDEQTFARAHASPAVRRFARELGVDLGQVQGAGRKGRITRDDVKAYVKSVLSGHAARRSRRRRCPRCRWWISPSMARSRSSP